MLDGHCGADHPAHGVPDEHHRAIADFFDQVGDQFGVAGDGGAPFEGGRTAVAGQVHRDAVEALAEQAGDR